MLSGFSKVCRALKLPVFLYTKPQTMLNLSHNSRGSSSSSLIDLGVSLPQGETEFSVDNKGPKKVKDRLRGSNAELSWLMRTSYISNETDARKQPAAARSQASEAVDQSADADEAHLQAAEVPSFSKRNLVILVKEGNGCMAQVLLPYKVEERVQQWRPGSDTINSVAKMKALCIV